MTTVINIRTLPKGADGRYHMPENHVYIGRYNTAVAASSSSWANPFPLLRGGSREAVLQQWLAYLRKSPDMIAAAPVELKDKALVCWCKPLACHGDELARIANESGQRSDCDY